MPGKLRKSRSRNNNNNRPASRQSRKRKTPKGKGKARKTTRRRNKKQNGMLNINKSKVKHSGGTEAVSATKCEDITVDFLKSNEIYFSEVNNETDEPYNVLKLGQLMVIIGNLTCDDKFLRSLLNSIISLTEQDQGVINDIIYILKSKEIYGRIKTATKMVEGFISSAISAAMSYKPRGNNNLIGWSLLNKKGRLQQLQNRELDTPTFNTEGLKLLFTDSDDDITCSTDGKQKKLVRRGDLYDFHVKEGQYNTHFTATSKERRTELLEGRDIIGGKITLTQEEKNKRKEGIEKIFIDRLEDIIFEKIKNYAIKRSDEPAAVRKAKIIELINKLRIDLAIATDRWFMNFYELNTTNIQYDSPQSGEAVTSVRYDPYFHSKRFYAERIFELFKARYKITLGE